MVKLINKCGHEIGYNLIEEIEMEIALKVINEQTLNRVRIPDECNKPDNPPIALMLVENIDNLECTISGAGTSHRVNSILVLKQEHREGAKDNSGGEVPEEPPAKRKCKRSLAGDVVNKGSLSTIRVGGPVGPVVLSYVQYLGNSSSYMEITKRLHMYYCVWIELRKLRIHPLLFVLDWTGFFIKVRDSIVVIQSTIGYLNTLDSPATDLKTAYGVICLGCEIKERHKLKAVACVFDQAFYAKTMKVFWKHKAQFESLVIMMGGFRSSTDDDAGDHWEPLRRCWPAGCSCPERNNS